MRTMRLSLLSLLALVFLAGSGIGSNAGAQIRIDATYRSPNVRVRVSNKPVSYPVRMNRYLPIRAQRDHRISKQDQMMARRLGHYTGVPARELIQLKRQGYGWFEIGRWLYLPRSVVRAAQHEQSWERFLRTERRLAMFGKRGHMTQHVAYQDDESFYDD